MKINQIVENKICLTCVYRKLYPPTMRDGQPVFFRFLCGLSMDSQKDIVRPEDSCKCLKSVTLG
jgi:hypothetical protein